MLAELPVGEVGRGRPMTDQELGATVRWLSALPADGHVRVLVFCDEAEMTFGQPHRANTEITYRGEGETLVEQLAYLDARRAEIEARVRR